MKKSVLWASMLLLTLAGCSSDDGITINDENILGYWMSTTQVGCGRGGLLFTPDGEIKVWSYGGQFCTHAADDSATLIYSEHHWGYFWFDDDGTIKIQNRPKDSAPYPDEPYYAVSSLSKDRLAIRVFGGLAGISYKDGYDTEYQKLPGRPQY